MIASERQELIRNLIQSKGSISIKELGKRFKESRMTLWRDLKILENKGLIKRIYGGAIKKQISIPFEPSFEEKELTSLSEKQLIAQYAAQNLVEDGDSICLGAGSTILQMIPYLNQINLTILTNGLNAMMMASKPSSNLRVIGCGGEIRKPALAFVGPEAEEFFLHKNVDAVFLSGTGITINEGITDPHLLDVQIKRAMIKSAKKVIFLMDSSKVGKVSLDKTISLNEINLLIIDNKVPKSFIEELKREKINYEII